MSKSVLYAANTQSQTVAPNGVVNFGTIVRRYGTNCNLSGGDAVIAGAGYYNVDTNLSFTTTAGTLTIQVYKDGVAIPGARVIRTVVADTSYAITIPCVVRERCCCDNAITVGVTGTTLTISNAAIRVEKI